MWAEVGHFALVLALTISLAQSIVPHIGAWKRDPNLLAFASYASFAQFAFVALSFAILMRAFALSDFSILLVASNSNSAMPLPFRVSATWGNHEGSLLLWIFILAIFGAAVTAAAKLPETMKARVLAIQGLISASFLGLTIFTSNPFVRLHPAPTNGFELNPLLQDIGLVLHPPFLYLGYVGVSIVFSFAVAALLEGKVDALWARLVRPWILLAWIFLTIGITLGSYWAYYELGWGGWWFWDPVENASFMPWLICTALLHSAIVVERRQTLIVWTLLLAILTFSLSLVGTFIVRSGIITSVHAFASDPDRGVWILGILIFFTGGALTLFSLRAHKLTSEVSFRPISREGGLILNNILLVVATATVFLGTFYPLLVELTTTDRISVGPPYFNRSFVPLMFVLMLALSAGVFLHWKRDTMREVLFRIRWIAIAVLAIVLVLLFVFGLRRVGALFSLGIAAWLVFGAIAVWFVRARIGQVTLKRSWELTRNTPRAVFGMILSHAGLGVLVAGIAVVTTWQQEEIAALPLGGSVEAGGYRFTLENVENGFGPNYQVQRALIALSLNDETLRVLEAERRYYPVSKSVTTEAAIHPRGVTNLYASLGGPADADTWVVRVYYHPWVIFIWLGPSLMALGGLVSLSDRRIRISFLARRPITRSSTMPAE
ncbi:heme lyase CcmF/NrfE family subunit [Ruegeria pomeroyi]|nr:heme lyase CcmF/NrfE family subunit [Ruegeria pomeroyi]MCE8534619.1 heme lyase CcmF/NrfE family subunit [Ruegeria pomeroyi]